MSYIINQDVIDRVGTSAALRLTTDSGDVVDQDVITKVREGAEGEANGYLAVRYAVPVDLSTHTDLAGTLKSFVLDIAVYRLMGRRPPVTEAYLEARKHAVKWLTDVSTGKVKLPAATTPASTTSDEPGMDWGSFGQDAAVQR